MDTLTLLQHYWWLIISLLGALLVFLLFVQGGQGLLYDIGKTEEERNMLVNSLGRKWEFTFTTPRRTACRAGISLRLRRARRTNMPKRTDIKRILVIGSGPIVIEIGRAHV